jgi:hypothetical protein
MSSFTADDCLSPSCEILKPHRHIPGGVVFDFAREIKRLTAELASLKAQLAVATQALEFYADEKKWFMRDEVTNLQQTTAIFHTDKPEELPTEFKSRSYQCTARLKVDQGKTARDALGAIGQAGAARMKGSEV